MKRYEVSEKDKEIGLRIKEIRRMKNISQEEFSKQIGISRPLLANIEMGNRPLKPFVLQADGLTVQLSNCQTSSVLSPKSKVLASKDAVKGSPITSHHKLALKDKRPKTKTKDRKRRRQQGRMSH